MVRVLIYRENLDIKAFFFPCLELLKSCPVLPKVPIKFRETQQVVCGWLLQLALSPALPPSPAALPPARGDTNKMLLCPEKNCLNLIPSRPSHCTSARIHTSLWRWSINSSCLMCKWIGECRRSSCCWNRTCPASPGASTAGGHSVLPPVPASRGGVCPAPALYRGLQPHLFSAPLLVALSAPAFRGLGTGAGDGGAWPPPPFC